MLECDVMMVRTEVPSVCRKIACRNPPFAMNYTVCLVLPLRPLIVETKKNADHV